MITLAKFTEKLAQNKYTSKTSAMRSLALTVEVDRITRYFALVAIYEHFKAKPELLAYWPRKPGYTALDTWRINLAFGTYRGQNTAIAAGKAVLPATDEARIEAHAKYRYKTVRTEQEKEDQLRRDWADISLVPPGEAPALRAQPVVRPMTQLSLVPAMQPPPPLNPQPSTPTVTPQPPPQPEFPNVVESTAVVAPGAAPPVLTANLPVKDKSLLRIARTVAEMNMALAGMRVDMEDLLANVGRLLEEIAGVSKTLSNLANLVTDANEGDD